MKVKRALVSVSDKRDLEPFVRGLVDLGVEVISTGGTARYLQGSRAAHHRHLRGHRLPRDHGRPGQDPASRPSTAASWPTAAGPAHLKAIADLGIKPIDLVVVNLYPFEAHRRQRGRRAKTTPSRTSTSAAPPWCARRPRTSAGWASSPTRPTTTPVLAELKANGGELSLRDPAQPGGQGLPAHRPLRLGHRQLVRRAGGRLPRTPHARPGQGPGPALRREPAPAGRLVLRTVDAHGDPAATLEQLHGQASCRSTTCSTSTPPGAAWTSSPCPAASSSSTTTPAAWRVAETVAVGLREGPLLRPGLRLRRRDRHQPRGGRGRWPGCSPPTSSRCSGRPATPRRPWRSSRVKKDIRILTGQDQPRHLRHLRHEARLRRHAGAGLGLRGRPARQHGGGHHPASHRGGVGRPALRLAGGQAHQVERHHPGQGPHDRRRGRRPDEPGGLRQPGREPGPLPAGRLRGGLGRLLPLPGRAGGGGRRRRDAAIHPGGSKRDDESLALAESGGWPWWSRGGGTSDTRARGGEPGITSLRRL